MSEHNYYSIITADVLFNPNLKDKAKLIFALVCSLTNEKGFCWASNTYLADKFNCTKRTITNALNDLKKEGLIDIKYIYKNDTKEIEKRYITPVEKNFTMSRKNFPMGTEKNFRVNTKDINTKVYNTIPPFSEFLEYALNKKNVDEQVLKLKYDSWVENNWRTAKDKKIKNWKTTLLNTLPYLEEKKEKKKWKLNATNPNR